MSGKRSMVMTGAFAALVLCALVVDPALAQDPAGGGAGGGGSSNIGQSIGKEMQLIGAALLFPVAGWAGLTAYGKRDYGTLTSVVVVTTVLSAFLVEPKIAESTIKQLWQNVA